MLLTGKTQAVVKALFKKSLWFTILLGIVLAINFPIISFNFYYPEQPVLYLANQKISHFYDLINIYLHPQWLHMVVPFFRPSGHFLIYQIITPFFGWHNNQAFLIINFLFLALTGCLMIANYQLLFPHWRGGAYIAFSIYLMHPALSISRFTIMHFEFAYTCFFMLGLYFFILFCKKNTNQVNSLSNLNFTHYSLLGCALFFYIFAVTFKEPAIVLGPIFLIYFLFAFYQKHSILQFLHALFFNPSIRHLFILIWVVSFTLSIYLTLSWPSLSYPSVTPAYSLGAINELLKAFLGIHANVFASGILISAGLVWRSVVFPFINLYVMQLCLVLTILGIILLFMTTSQQYYDYKKSVLFLICASLSCSILPVLWSVGAPWHLSLTIIFFSMLAGYSCELLGRFIITNNKALTFLLIALSLLIAATTIPMNNANLQAYEKMKKINFLLALNRNAIEHPPLIKDKLDAKSLIVVEDSSLHSDYAIGNAAYPFLIVLNDQTFPVFNTMQPFYFMKFHPNYSSNLFRWAYLMPQLKEELYPFIISKMNEVPNEIIYNWLKHYPNIFCIGYDDNASWSNRTNNFKHQLLIEKYKRSLIVNTYSAKTKAAFSGKIYQRKILIIPDPKLCEYTCDQDKSCKGFTYRNIGFNQRPLCELHTSLNAIKFIPCTYCISFKKISNETN